MPSSSYLKYHWKQKLMQPRYAAFDARENARWCTAGRRILVVRHAGKHPFRQQYYLDWLARAFPELRSLFELRLLPCRVRDWSPYCLYLPWFQDPAIDWMHPATYARALELEQRCVEHGIGIINPIEHASNCIRSVAFEKLTAEGIRTPRVIPITHPQRFLRDLGGLSYPLIVRDDRGHGKSVMLIRQQSDLAQVRFDKMRYPIAVEWVNVAAEDGSFHKCRFVVAGSVGVRRHRMVSRNWEVRANGRVANEQTRAEELAYLQAPAPEHRTLDQARRCLNLDWAAFDYSFDHHGQLVIWETNPYPSLRFLNKPEHAYTLPYVERSLAAMTHMFLTAAGLPVPDEVTRRMLLHVGNDAILAPARCESAAA